VDFGCQLEEEYGLSVEKRGLTRTGNARQEDKIGEAKKGGGAGGIPSRGGKR